jgi:pyruvate-ferredoxin/flavodoxin oxidoreductase
MRDFLEKQTRYSALHTIKQNQEVVEHLLDKTKEDAIERSESYNKLVTHMKK